MAEYFYKFFLFPIATLCSDCCRCKQLFVCVCSSCRSSYSGLLIAFSYVPKLIKIYIKIGHRDKVSNF